MLLREREAAPQGGSAPAPVRRRFASLRLSLTAACNFRCRYCVAEGERLRPLPDQVPGAALVAMLGLLREAGLRKLRLNPGDPREAPALPCVLEALPELGFQEVAITTNGSVLEAWAPRLADAGVQRLNLSLDSIAPKAFAAATGGGDLPRVLRGLQAALASGMEVRVNAVPMRTCGPGAWLELLDFCLERGLELRFIELMRMGHLHGEGAARRDWGALYVPADEILRAVGARYRVRPLGRPPGATAARYEVRPLGRLTDPSGAFGIVANESQPFCADCDRLRLASNGKLYGCITAAKGYPMAPLLDLPPPRARRALKELLGVAMRRKPQAFRGGWTSMRVLGG